MTLNGDMPLFGAIKISLTAVLKLTDSPDVTIADGARLLGCCLAILPLVLV